MMNNNLQKKKKTYKRNSNSTKQKNMNLVIKTEFCFVGIGNHKKYQNPNIFFAKIKWINRILIRNFNLINIKMRNLELDLKLVVLNLWGFRVLIIIMLLLGVIVVGGGKSIHEGSDIGGCSSNGINGCFPCCVTVFIATAATVAIVEFFFCHCLLFQVSFHENVGEWDDSERKLGFLWAMVRFRPNL